MFVEVAVVLEGIGNDRPEGEEGDKGVYQNPMVVGEEGDILQPLANDLVAGHVGRCCGSSVRDGGWVGGEVAGADAVGASHSPRSH